MIVPSDFKPAHGAVLTIEDVLTLANALTVPDAATRDRAMELLVHRSDAHAHDTTRKAIRAFQEGAENLTKDGHIEVDENPSVSIGDDPGAYVQAWLWVPSE